MADADVVVIAAGRAGDASQTRLELLRDNAAITRDIGGRLQAASFRGIVIMLTNPVDVLTHVMTQASGLPASRVLGTGTMLETSRLRQMIGERLGIDPRSVHAQVVGEHGDSNVVLWSGARIGGRALRDWPGWKPEHENELGEAVRVAAYEIIRRKGATNHAIGLVTAQLLKAIFRDAQRVLTVSRVQQDACGIDGVALSLPAVVGRAGATTIVAPDMDAGEQDAFARSAAVLARAQQEAEG